VQRTHLSDLSLFLRVLSCFLVPLYKLRVIIHICNDNHICVEIFRKRRIDLRAILSNIMKGLESDMQSSSGRYELLGQKRRWGVKVD